MKNRASMNLVCLGLAVALALAVASAVTAQPGKFVKGVLQPLADGFPNRPLILMVVDPPALLLGGTTAGHGDRVHWSTMRGHRLSQNPAAEDPSSRYALCRADPPPPGGL